MTKVWFRASMSKELITETGIPHWMQPPKLHRGEPYPEWIWETVLSELSAGRSLRSICAQDHMPDEARLRSWIFADESRKSRYYDARAIGADKIEDEILTIADGGEDAHGLPEEVQRSQLRINARFKLLAVWNRNRYGEQKQVDVNHNLDLSKIIEEANKRLEGNQEKVIEGELVNG